jgi:large subunit ribosomal protein L1
MGKIKVAALGSEDEQKLREEKKVKREEKKKREEAGKIHIPGMKGGERVKSVGAQSEEEVNKLVKLAQDTDKDQTEGIDGKKVSKKKIRVKVRSQKYKQAVIKLEHKKEYPINEALPILRDVSYAKFDASVELHINTNDKGLRGNVMLPHGTGKQVRVAIAASDTIDKIVEAVENGKIDFDALVAHPSVMAKLAKVAKVLGPKGLMPNPKAGTISTTPEKVAEKLSKGEIAWKTESDFPIIHQVIGKMSFKDKQLEENFKAFVKSIGDTKIKNITLKSSMSPGIKVKTG